MPSYVTNDSRFEVPDGFVDRTVTRLEARTENGATILIMVHKSRFVEEQHLDDAVASHLKDASANLRAHSVLANREARLAGHPAYDIAMRWREDDGMVYMREMHADVDGTWFIVSSTGPLEERETCDSCFEYMIPTIELNPHDREE
ncbi:MAG: DcrB-related protein [Polyangiaceae bacterium]|nr:DcrB-related protein [Polyangiaceae bacterium]